jgi:hypothetical protein
MSPAVRLRLAKLILSTTILAAPLACGEGGTDVVLPSLRITAATSGLELDPDGYTVSIDGQAPLAIGVSGTLVAEGLADGPHTLELSGVAANCALAGDNPRSVTTTAGSTATAAFVVTCSASAGSIEIVTTTTGTGTDSDGFGLQLDGVDRGPMAVNASSTLAGLTAGTHIIGLTGLAPTCQVSGENPRSISVPAGEVVQVSFAITCSLPGPTSGTIAVTTATTGGGADPDGYSLLLDGVDRGAIGVNGSISLAGLTSGSHTIGITGVAANCQLSGENPRSVTVPAGGSVQVSFAISCSAPGPTTGTIAVTTVTTGGGTDPDGYSLLLDGIDRGPIAVNASNNLTGLPDGAHTIGLSGLAANCQVSGENPRAVTVPAGGTVAAAFAIACTAPGPATGSLAITTITTGPSQDADGYLVAIDGSGNRPIGASATVTVGNISAGQHSVELRGLASNCSVTGTNPLGVAVQAGETARISFSVTCVATVGSLRITIDGLPANTDAAVTVEGPGNFSQLVKTTSTLTALAPGTYAVTAADVVSGGTTYRPAVGRPSVPVAAGATASSTVSYTPVVVTPTLNLRIDAVNLTQSIQTYASDVPLVAGRSGYLRVFVVANQANTARPAVRVNLSGSGGSQSFTIQAPATVPTRVQEGEWGSSWNLEIPAALIQPGLTVMAELDPDDSVAESNESDNRFPATGTKSQTVRGVAPARIRFVSVQQGSSPPGDVSNTGRLLDLARRMHPLNAVDVDVDGTVFPTGALAPNGDGWFQLLSDLDGKRVAEGSDRIYFGIVKLGYGREGLVGLTLGQGIPTAAGWDDQADAGRVVAHELGHVWGRTHAPCGNPPNVDGLFPYPGGRIGVYGLDANPPVTGSDLKAPTSPDIMGYCFDSPWISDYTYRNIMDFRATHAFVVARNAEPQPSLLVWGRLVNGQPVLEPAFQIVARPNLPQRPGPYTVTATALDGSQLFHLSFDITEAEDGPPGNGHFAFAVPLEQARASRIGTIDLGGPAGAASNQRALAQVTAAPAVESIELRREGNTVALNWDARTYPMIMVRDPETGAVLAFARGGRARVQTSKGELDLEISDGVRSQRRRVAISRS